MWWTIGIAIWLMLLFVVLALCRAAGDADRGIDQHSARKLERTEEHHDHAA